MNILNELCVWGMVAAAEGSAGGGGAPGGGPELTQTLIMVAAFIGIFYFLMIRPNQKRERQRLDMLSKLSKGDRVLTTGGVLGTVIGVTEQMVVLRISEEPPVKVEFVKSAVARVIPKNEA